MVCLGAFLFVASPVMLDMTSDMKIAAQVVSGIGFLGAGVILKDGANIRGLNTAATLWCNAAIGVLCAYGLVLEAATGAGFILVANIILRYITKKVTNITDNIYSKNYVITIVLSKSKEIVLRTTFIQMINESDIKLNSMETQEQADDKIKIIADITAGGSSKNEMDHIITRFTMEPGVYYVGYKKSENDSDDEDN